MTPEALILTSDFELSHMVRVAVERFGITAGVALGTPDALKATLLKAQSIASIPESATGYSIARVFDRLGITEPMKAKMKAQPNPSQVVAVVATGEVELGLFLINVLTAPGLDVVGPFPAELQEIVVFTAAVASQAIVSRTDGGASRCRRVDRLRPAPPRAQWVTSKSNTTS